MSLPVSPDVTNVTLQASRGSTDKKQYCIWGDPTLKLSAAGAAFGSAEETTPVPRQSEDALGRWKRCGDVDRTCSYLESLRQRDGAYAFPGQDASHLSATYAAVMTYAALGCEVPGDHAALARAVAGPLYPVAGDRDAARMQGR